MVTIYYRFIFKLFSWCFKKLIFKVNFFIFSRLINEHECNIFGNMQKTDFREFRNLIIEMVLHTDMSQHFSQLKAIKSMIQQNSGESR